jgi:conjugal transfer pilus assembly protein TraU
MGYWSPEHLIETVRNPWCSPMLGFDLIPDETTTFQDIMAKAQIGSASGDQGAQGESANAAMFNMHWIMFPGGKLVNFLMDFLCTPKSAFDIDYGYVSEIDPTWHNDILSLYTTPEAHVFTRMYAHAACIADGVAATVRKPIQGLFWCAGTMGMVYPMDGHPAREEGFDSQMSVAARGIAHMHRFGLAKLSYGDQAVCQDCFWFVMPHQQYQFQNFWPMPVRTNAYWIGTSDYWGGWGIGRTLPVVGEDRLVMEWQYRECCATLW